MSLEKKTSQKSVQQTPFQTQPNLTIVFITAEIITIVIQQRDR